MVTIDEVRALARSLPRTSEALVVDAWRMVVPKRVGPPTTSSGSCERRPPAGTP
jgi:hypothetical protein